jgi:Flp pilus assembly protein TadG
VSRSTRTVADERGAVAVEFALLLPLLVTLLMGIIQMGLAFNEKLTLTHAAREGARAAIVGADPVSAVKDAASSVDLATSDIDVVPCDDDEVGEQAEVEASTDFEFSIPFVDLGAVTLSSSAVMRCP